MARRSIAAPHGGQDATDAGARRHALTGAWLVIAAALLWAGIGPIATPLLDRGWEPAQIAFWRAAIGGAAFLVHAALTRDWAHQSRGLLAGFGLIGVSLFYVALPAAIDSGGLSLAWLLLYTAPAWVALLAPRIVGEPRDRRTTLLVATTVLGVVLVAAGGGDGITVTPASIGWGVTAGLTYASWYLVTRRSGTTPVATAALALPVGALGLAPFARWPGSDVEAWLLLAALGLASTWLPVLAYYHGVARIPVTRAAVLATIEPVAALSVAVAFGNETLRPLAMLGAGVIVATSVAAAVPARRRRVS